MLLFRLFPLWHVTLFYLDYLFQHSFTIYESKYLGYVHCTATVTIENILEYPQFVAHTVSKCWKCKWKCWRNNYSDKSELTYEVTTQLLQRTHNYSDEQMYTLWNDKPTQAMATNILFRKSNRLIDKFLFRFGWTSDR